MITSQTLVNLEGEILTVETAAGEWLRCSPQELIDLLTAGKKRVQGPDGGLWKIKLAK